MTRRLSPLMNREQISQGVDRLAAELQRDPLKLVVAERYRAYGEVGVGLVKGFGLKKGALASSISHDSHNIIAVGISDEDILIAIAEVARLQRGLVAADRNAGSALPAPLAALSFLALPVIPELRLTPLGLVDGVTGKLLD